MLDNNKTLKTTGKEEVALLLTLKLLEKEYIQEIRHGKLPAKEIAKTVGDVYRTIFDMVSSKA